MGSGFSGLSREDRAFSRGYEQGSRDAYQSSGQPPYYDERLAEKALKAERKRRRRGNAAIIASTAGASTGCWAIWESICHAIPGQLMADKHSYHQFRVETEYYTSFRCHYRCTFWRAIMQLSCIWNFMCIRFSLEAGLGKRLMEKRV